MCIAAEKSVSEATAGEYFDYSMDDSFSAPIADQVEVNHVGFISFAKWERFWGTITYGSRRLFKGDTNLVFLDA
jgi:hypothetical protein